MSSIGSSAPDNFQLSLLQESARGNEKKVRELLDDAAWHPRMDSDTLRQSLCKVATRGNLRLARFLLEKGAEVDVRVDNEVSALQRAADMGHVEIVELLLDHRASTEAKDKFGRTALFLAALKGHIEVVRLLLNANAYIDAKDREGRTALVHLAAEKSWKYNQPMVELLLERNAYIEERDKTRRTALLWAAATGKEELVALLLSGRKAKKADVRAFNNRGRTALHLAAENNHEGIVKMLLDNGANPTTTSDGGWTALHNAAEKGHTGVCALLLDTKADINAETSSGMTALHWAAQNGHKDVVHMIIARPDAKLATKDSFDSTPMLRAAQKGHRDIVHLLSPIRDGPRLSPDAKSACEGFEATIVDFGMESRHSNVSKHSVYDLLYGWDAKNEKQLVHTLVRNVRSKPDFRWIHLPANNVSWAEALITKAFIEDDVRNVEDFKALEKCFGQEHRGPMIHAHFMRTFCQRMAMHEKQNDPAETPPNDSSVAVKVAPLTEKPQNTNQQSNSKLEKKKDTKKDTKKISVKNEVNGTGNKGGKAGKWGTKETKPAPKTLPKNEGKPPPALHGKLVLFMPYLHYETDEQREKMSRAIKASASASASASKDETSDSFTPDDALIRAYLRHSPPLHARRTLDQFFYHGIDTADRDRDQVVYRYCCKRDLEPKLFMVDQLWLWTFGKELIITSFPQRWQQPKNDPLNVLDGIIEDMNAKTRPPVRSVYDLAMLITSRCSGVFDRHRLGYEEFQFLDMFESSIGHVTNKETKLFARFNKASAEAAKWLRKNRKSRRSQSRPKKAEHSENEDLDYDRDPLFVDALLDIGIESKLLAEIKDIRDELNIISMVLKYQLSVLPDLADVICEELGGRKSSKSFEVRKRSKDQVKIIEVHIKDVERMDKQAEGIYTSLTHLLDLKQKHANAFEARFARDQMSLTARQGQTIMVFTIVTIVFLPMSFMAAFFTINIDEFPRNPDGSQGMHLSWVSKYMFGIGLAISIPLIALAFTVEDITKAFRRLSRSIFRFFASYKGDPSDEKQRLGESWSTVDSSPHVQKPKESSARKSFGLDHDIPLSPIGPPPRSFSRRTDLSWASLDIGRGRRSGDLERGQGQIYGAPLAFDTFYNQSAAGHWVLVEKSPTEPIRKRIFEDSEFEAAGAQIVEEGSWKSAPTSHIILGLKELPEADFPLSHQHISFFHCYKHQTGWENPLRRLADGKGLLYDLEFLEDDNGRRVAAFGYHAGFAGAALAVKTWAWQLKHGKDEVLPDVATFTDGRGYYLDEEELVNQIHADLEEGQKIAGRAPRAFIMGALGRCGKGAGDLFQKIGLAEENVIKWDINETKGNPGPYKEIIESDIFVNCIYLMEKTAPFIDEESLRAAGADRKLSVVCDVSCDPNSPNNPIPIYTECTTFDHPTTTCKFPLEQGPPLTIIAIDHLPSMEPRGASEAYSNALLPSLLQLKDRQTAPVWQRAEKLFHQKVATLPEKQ